jgi:hypothetical protein
VIHNNFAYAISGGWAIQWFDPKTAKSQLAPNRKIGLGQRRLVDDVFLLQSELSEIYLIEANPKERKELTSHQDWSALALQGLSCASCCFVGK